MGESAVREKYGFTDSDTFEAKFSKVSIEGLLLYVVAFGIWAMEKLFDSHKTEVDTMLADRLPHTTRWYQQRVLAMVPSGTEEAPVKYCSVDDRGARLKIKVAGGEAGAREPISADHKAALESWLEEEKDAGLKITVVNLAGDDMEAALTVWYDPMELTPSEKPVEAALKEYVSNLDFDGVLSRNGIIDALREVAGVEMVRIDTLRSKAAASAEWHTFGEQEQAESGWWQPGSVQVVYNRYTKGNIQ